MRAAVVLSVALLGTAAAGLAPASAAWSAPGPGSAYAKAGLLGTPAPVFGTPSCNKPAHTVSVPVVWPSVDHAGAYDLRWDTSTALANTVSPATSPTTVTASGLQGQNTKTISVQVRSTTGSWHSPYSTTVSTTVGPC